MVNITIDGKTYSVPAGQNLLQACQTLGLELPYFCWHPAMGSVGSCRQCAVTQHKNREDRRGKIIVACMTPVTEGLIVSIQNQQAKKFRAMLIEAVMTNHPHDCPVCEEGGECHLQDMTLMSGHTERRFPGPKRTHRNQYLGPFINHEMNRCIACYRCTRFYRDYSGGTDLNVFASRSNVYFGRAEDGNLESEFSGNLVEVCPTGVFTDKTLSEHYTRKWDLESAPSICTQCSVGCNIYPAEHKGMLRRVQNRFHPSINGHFICDRGRFGYGFVNHVDRLIHVWQRGSEGMSTKKITAAEAQPTFKTYLNSSSVMAIGSARSSLENNYALLAAVGANHFYAGIPAQELQQNHALSQAYTQHLVPASTVKSIEAADAALMIGEDVTQTAPMIALSIRQMIRNAGKAIATTLEVPLWQDAAVRNITQQLKSPVHIISSHSTRLDDIAAEKIIADTALQIALLTTIESLLNSPEKATQLHEPMLQQAQTIASDLRNAKKPVIVTGTNSSSEALLAATLKLAQTLYQLNDQCEFVCAVAHSNSMGLAQLTLPQHSLTAALAKMATDPPETLIVLETDLYRYCATETLDKLFENIKNIVVLDHLLTPTAQVADLLLPTASFAEAHGSWVNYEGRVQAAISCFPPEADRKSAWQWISADSHYHQLLQGLAESHPCFSELPTLHPSASDGFHIARKTIRATGRTATYAVADVREYPPASDVDSPYAYTLEGVSSPQLNNIIATDADHSAQKIPPAYIWAPNWNSNEALSFFQEDPNGPIRGSHEGLLIFKDINKNINKNINSGALYTSPLNKSSVQIPENAIQLLPHHNIFADEELSSYVRCIQQRAPQPAVTINTKEAQARGLQAGTKITLSNPNCTTQLALTIDDSVPDNVALIPAALTPSLGHFAFLGESN